MTDLRPKSTNLRLARVERPDLKFERPDLRPEGPEKPDLRPKRPDLRPDLWPGRPNQRGMDKRISAPLPF